jgi:hypothetical protein
MIAERHYARDERVVITLWRLLTMILRPPLTPHIATGANRSAGRGNS